MSDNGNAQNLVRELEALEQLYNFLVGEICDKLTNLNSSFRGYINIMVSTGIPKQECEEFSEKYYSDDETNFKAIFEQIVTADLPQIKNYMEQIERQFQAATNSSYGGFRLMSPSPASSQAPSGASERDNSVQDYELQIDAICDFMDFLVSQKEGLFQTINAYERYCNSLLEYGVPKQVVDHYVNNYALSNVRFIRDTIISHITDKDYPQLAGLYNEIVDSMKAVNSSPNRTPKSIN